MRTLWTRVSTWYHRPPVDLDALDFNRYGK